MRVTSCIRYTPPRWAARQPGASPRVIPICSQEAHVMTSNRREFIEHLGATAMLGALPLTTMPSVLQAFGEPPKSSAEEFDFTCTAKLKGKKHKACFDCAEVESGYGVWRAGMWEPQ